MLLPVSSDDATRSSNDTTRSPDEFTLPAKDSLLSSSTKENRI